MKNLTKLHRLLLSVLAGIVTALAMPKPGIWLLAWFGMVPLFVAFHDESPKRCMLYALACGTTYYSIVLFWITVFGYAPWVALSLMETAYLVLFGATVGFLCRGWKPASYVVIPALWVLFQWFRTLGPYGLPWGSFAHSQVAFLPISQLGSVTGPWGVEWLVCTVNVSLAAVIVRGQESVPRAAAALACVAMLTGVGAISMSHTGDTGTRSKVAIIQGSAEHGMHLPEGFVERTFRTYVQMSGEAAASRPDFVVWPESTLPTPIVEAGYERAIGDMARITNANYIVGAYFAPDPKDLTSLCNSAFFFDRTGSRVGLYKKVRLVPFGEFVPFRKQLPFLKGYGVRDYDLHSGPSYNLVDTEIGQVGAIICFESLFPEIARTEVAAGAKVLFVITNDSWFERSQAAKQHLMMSQLRAIETDRFIVRAASTGISAIVDPHGSIMSDLSIFTPGIVKGDIAPRTVITPYVRYGDYFVWLCAAVAAMSVVVRFKRTS